MTGALLVNEQVLRVGHPVGEEIAGGPRVDARNSLQPEQYVLESSVACGE